MCVCVCEDCMRAAPSCERQSPYGNIFGGVSRKEGNVLFNDALNTFYFTVICVGHMVKDHSDSERGNQMPPHGLFFPINSKCSFICTIPQIG